MCRGALRLHVGGSQRAAAGRARVPTVAIQISLNSSGALVGPVCVTLFTCAR